MAMTPFSKLEWSFSVFHQSCNSLYHLDVWVFFLILSTSGHKTWYLWGVFTIARHWILSRTVVTIFFSISLQNFICNFM